MTSIQTTVAPRQRSASSSTTSTSPKDRGRFSSISSHTSNMMNTPITDTASVHERATTESEGSLLASPSSFNMYQPLATQSRRNSSILEALGPIESPPIPAQQVLEMPNLPTSRVERFREQDVIKSRRSSVASLVQPLRASSALAEERSHPIAPDPVQVPSPLDPDHVCRRKRTSII
ncbi:uncharacterized protein EI90DRAFT_621867 [Cantharellus anzutake]|uniref:uncharacterized protein n=1 Tax=Cantharellus anzutake TaxID=1750568 RepID=UPI001908FAF0|nr:uncharacterized protein EI90DRAFT_621867 [Cantharellus anzutake]KAF8333069.1 hypothetical protein EI90DRAFT_621867 [Cantharellus anzutake]